MENMHTGLGSEPDAANEPARRMRGRRRPPRALMMLMPVMMLTPLCMQFVIWRTLRRIERRLDALESERSGAGANQPMATL